MARLVLGDVGGEPVAELLGVHDVGLLERLVDAQVAVAQRQRERVAHAPARQAVAQRARRHLVDPQRARLERVGSGTQVGDLEALGQLAPRAQLPRRDLVPADDQDARHGGRG